MAHLRIAPMLAALALLAGPVPTLAQAQAQASAPFFTATLAAPAAESRFTAGGVVWHCEGTACRAARSTARPLRVCNTLRREAGAVAAFAANGAALPAEDLARCNG